MYSRSPAFIGSLIRQLHTGSEDLSTNLVSDLSVLVSEVKGLKESGLSKGKASYFFCEVELNGEVCARTSCKASAASADTIFWGESFQYVNLRLLRTASVKLYRDVGKRKGPSQCIGSVAVPITEAGHGEFREVWYSLEGAAKGHSTLQLRIRSACQQLIILDPDCYKGLLQYVLDDVKKMCQVLEPLLPSKSKDELAQTLVYILKAHRKVVNFVSAVLVQEVETLERENLILRANSFASKSIDCYMKLTGTQYLKEVLTPVLLYIIHQAPECEVDPTRLGDDDGSSLEANQQVLLSIVERVWSTIYQCLDSFPLDLRYILSDVRSRVADRGEMVWKRIVSATVFLRYFCPAILSPSLFHITYQYPNEKACRRLTLVAKVIQNLANATRFGSKEAYMLFLNDFMDKEMPTMDIYLNHVSSSVDYSEDLEVQGVKTLTELSSFDLQGSDSRSIVSEESFDDMPSSMSKSAKAKAAEAASFERKPIVSLKNPVPENREVAILHRILTYHLPRLDPLATQELDSLVSLVSQLQADLVVEKARIASGQSPLVEMQMQSDRRSARTKSFPYLPATGDEEPGPPKQFFEKCLSEVDAHQSWETLDFEARERCWCC